MNIADSIHYTQRYAVAVERLKQRARWYLKLKEADNRKLPPRRSQGAARG